MVDLLQADGLDGGRSARDQNPVLKSAQNGCGIVRVDVGHLKYITYVQIRMTSSSSKTFTSSPVSFPSESTLPTTAPPPLAKDQQTPEGLPARCLPTQTNLLLAFSLLKSLTIEVCCNATLLHVGSYLERPCKHPSLILPSKRLPSSKISLPGPHIFPPLVWSVKKVVKMMFILRAPVLPHK